VTAPGTRASALSYRAAGVDVEAKSALLEALTPALAATHAGGVVAGMGAFAGATYLPQGAGVLMATVDGVGTKTLLARRLDRDAVIGADIVAHCANDLVCHGAQPVAFLDYIAMARLQPRVVEAVVRAMAAACAELGIPLLGGETAEMPDVYAGDAYDVVGTMIGAAPPEGVITGAAITPGDRLVGLASTGLHTNGYSLVRRVLDETGIALDAYIPALGATVGEALMAPHRCYAAAVLSLLRSVRVHGIAHITGGGLAGNVVRVLPEGRRARIRRGWPQPPIFDWMSATGVAGDEMDAAFNMGIGMAVVVAGSDSDRTIEHFATADVPAFEIGVIDDGDRGVDLT
jgi:phosphoribosylformylglycinamidine cyclo-ligase